MESFLPAWGKKRRKNIFLFFLPSGKNGKRKNGKMDLEKFFLPVLEKFSSVFAAEKFLDQPEKFLVDLEKFFLPGQNFSGEKSQDFDQFSGGR